MSGNKILIDTNIALYFLNGNAVISELLDGNILYISFVTQLELLSFKKLTTEEKNQIEKFIKACVLIDVNEDIKIETVKLRQKYKIKLPDSLIAATAIFLDLPLMSADKGFTQIKEINLIIIEDFM